jgi:hypothetical protein
MRTSGSLRFSLLLRQAGRALRASAQLLTEVRDANLHGEPQEIVRRSYREILRSRERLARLEQALRTNPLIGESKGNRATEKSA